MFIDITKILKPSMAVYEGDPKFENDEIFSIERDGFNLNKKYDYIFITLDDLYR